MVQIRRYRDVETITFRLRIVAKDLYRVVAQSTNKPQRVRVPGW